MQGGGFQTQSSSVLHVVSGLQFLQIQISTSKRDTNVCSFNILSTSTEHFDLSGIFLYLQIKVLIILGESINQFVGLKGLKGLCQLQNC